MADYERQPRVLVVEDDDAIAQVLQRSLRMEGYEVRVAEDGVEALEHAHGFLPDLVILDLGLPGLDGLEVARRLRSCKLRKRASQGSALLASPSQRVRDSR